MAGRSGPSPDASAKPARAVEDGELFPPPLAKPATARPAEPKPHHADHRFRLRQRFDEAGPAALSDYELLELFLFRTIPRRDTKPLAKRLLKTFGSLPAVLAAPAHLLEKVEGAGAATAQDLKLAQALLERAGKAELTKRRLVSSHAQLVQYCRKAMAHERREQVRVLFLDTKNQLIADEVQNHGTIDHAPVYPREVARRALELGAASIILAHNHPSGDPTPSRADVAITRDVVAAAEAVGVRVHDHLIIGRDGETSLRSLGLM